MNEFSVVLRDTHVYMYICIYTYIHFLYLSLIHFIKSSRNKHTIHQILCISFNYHTNHVHSNYTRLMLHTQIYCYLKLKYMRVHTFACVP